MPLAGGLLDPKTRSSTGTLPKRDKLGVEAAELAMSTVMEVPSNMDLLNDDPKEVTIAHSVYVSTPVLITSKPIEIPIEITVDPVENAPKIRPKIKTGNARLDAEILSAIPTTPTRERGVSREGSLTKESIAAMAEPLPRSRIISREGSFTRERESIVVEPLPRLKPISREDSGRNSVGDPAVSSPRLKSVDPAVNSPRMKPISLDLDKVTSIDSPSKTRLKTGVMKLMRTKSMGKKDASEETPKTDEKVEVPEIKIPLSRRGSQDLSNSLAKRGSLRGSQDFNASRRSSFDLNSHKTSQEGMSIRRNSQDLGKKGSQDLNASRRGSQETALPVVSSSRRTSIVNLNQESQRRQSNAAASSSKEELPKVEVKESKLNMFRNTLKQSALKVIKAKRVISLFAPKKKEPEVPAEPEPDQSVVNADILRNALSALADDNGEGTPKTKSTGGKSSKPGSKAGSRMGSRSGSMTSLNGVTSKDTKKDRTSTTRKPEPAKSNSVPKKGSVSLKNTKIPAKKAIPTKAALLVPVRTRKRSVSSPNEPVNLFGDDDEDAPISANEITASDEALSKTNDNQDDDEMENVSRVSQIAMFPPIQPNVSMAMINGVKNVIIRPRTQEELARAMGSMGYQRRHPVVSHSEGPQSRLSVLLASLSTRPKTSKISNEFGMDALPAILIEDPDPVLDNVTVQTMLDEALNQLEGAAVNLSDWGRTLENDVNSKLYIEYQEPGLPPLAPISPLTTEPASMDLEPFPSSRPSVPSRPRLPSIGFHERIKTGRLPSFVRDRNGTVVMITRSTEPPPVDAAPVSLRTKMRTMGRGGFASNVDDVIEDIPTARFAMNDANQGIRDIHGLIQSYKDGLQNTMREMNRIITLYDMPTELWPESLLGMGRQRRKSMMKTSKTDLMDSHENIPENTTRRMSLSPYQERRQSNRLSFASSQPRPSLFPTDMDTDSDEDSEDETENQSGTTTPTESLPKGQAKPKPIAKPQTMYDEQLFIEPDAPVNFNRLYREYDRVQVEYDKHIRQLHEIEYDIEVLSKESLVLSEHERKRDTHAAELHSELWSMGNDLMAYYPQDMHILSQLENCLRRRTFWVPGIHN